jgi:hypothetical protein
VSGQLGKNKQMNKYILLTQFNEEQTFNKAVVFLFGVIPTIPRVTATPADGLCEVKILIKN